MEEDHLKHLPQQYIPHDIFKVELTHQQCQVLFSMLPKGYSLQIDNRKKDGKIQNKKKNPQQLLLASSIQFQLKSKPLNTYQAPPPPQPKKIPKQDLINQQVKPCIKLLQILQKHKCAWPFLQPVDVQGLNIPQYKQIVKEPMDFSTIQSKLKQGKYQTTAQFHSDVIKIFHNSYLFNAANEQFIKITNQLERYYYRISGETKPIEKIQVKPVNPQIKSQKKKKKPQINHRQLNDSQPMTLQQKKQLAFNIHRLAKEHIKTIKSIVFDGIDQNEFDLEQLSQKKLRELQRFIRNKIHEMQNNLRSNLMQKTEQQNLQELESSITEQFIDVPLEQQQS